MASAAQVAANKENAQRPRTLTEETKASLQTRAVKHGLTAKLYTNTVLQGEDQAAYNHMLQSLLAEATLGTTQEAMLIQVLAQTFWKMQRASNMEAGALNSGLAAAQLQLKLSEKPKTTTNWASNWHSFSGNTPASSTPSAVTSTLPSEPFSAPRKNLPNSAKPAPKSKLAMFRKSPKRRSSQPKNTRPKRATS